MNSNFDIRLPTAPARRPQPAAPARDAAPARSPQRQQGMPALAGAAGCGRRLPRWRVGLVLGLFAGLGILLFPSQRQSARAQPEKPATAEPLTELRIVQRVNAATGRALDYLESKQIKQGAEAGSWSPNQAINGLALLAFLSGGHVPGRGKYGDVVEQGVVKPGVLTRGKKYLLARAQPTGFISSSSMYEHGLATLALAEMYGMDPDPELEEKLRKAVDLILKCQSKAGGWRYTPAPVDQDLSVSVMQIVALRAADNAGIPVPEATLKNAIAYVQSCGMPGGGFGYSGPGAGPQTTAAGILSLQLLGKYDDPKVKASVALMPGFPIQWAGPNPNYFYYFHYYAIQAMYQAGGKEWNAWHPRIRQLLLEGEVLKDGQRRGGQNKDGSWDVPPGTAEVAYLQPNKVYPTAMATLILNIYQHYLPAYQR